MIPSSRPTRRNQVIYFWFNQALTTKTDFIIDFFLLHQMILTPESPNDPNTEILKCRHGFFDQLKVKGERKLEKSDLN